MTARRARRLVCCLAAALLVATLPGSALARRSTFHVLKLDQLGALFDFLVGVDRERHQLLDVDPEPSVATKIVLGQRLGLGARGSIVHPRFWYWRIQTNVLFVEDILRGDLVDRFADPDTRPARPGERYLIDPEFDVQFDFLREHTTPVTIYGRRKTDVIRREFQANTWVSTWAAGGSASWSNRGFPIAIHYDYLNNEGDRRQLIAGDESHQVYASGQHADGPSVTSIEYRMMKYDNRYDPTQEYLFHYGQVHNYLYLDQEQAYRLDSLLWVQSREARDLDQFEVRLREMFVARFLPSLRFRAEYGVAWQRWATNDFLQNTAWVELRHQLFKSLTSTARIRGTHDLGEASERLEGALSAAVSYRKDLGPLVMRHSYQVMGSWSRLDTQGQPLSVFDEPVTLEGEIPTPLDAREVDGTSLVVVDGTRTKRYKRGLDWDVRESEGVTYLRRVTGGEIPDGAEVLVTYDHRSDSTPKSTLVDQIYIGRLETDFSDYLRLHAQYTMHDVQVSSSLTPRDALRYHDVGTGIDVAGAGLRASAAFHYVTSEHYTAREVSGSLSYAIPISEQMIPVIGVRELFLQIDKPDETRNLLEAFTEARFPIWGPLTGFWSVTYHWDVGGANDGHYTLGRARLEWPVRKIRVWLEYVFAVERKEHEHYDRHTITLNVRRTF